MLLIGCPGLAFMVKENRGSFIINRLFCSVEHMISIVKLKRLGAKIRTFVGKIRVAFWPILKQTARKIGQDDCAFLSASITFFAFISLLPLCLVGATTFSWLMNIPWIQGQVDVGLKFLGTSVHGDSGLDYMIPLVQRFMPMQCPWVGEQLKVLADNFGTNLILSMLVGLWSGRHMFLAMENSLHRICNKTIKRTWIKRSLLAMYLIIVSLGLGVSLLIGAGLLSILEKLLNALPSLPAIWGMSLSEVIYWNRVISWGLIPFGVSMIFLMIYRLLPSEPIKLKYVIPGALFSGFTWRLASYLYLKYGNAFASVSVVYGSIWYILGLLFWLYVVAFVFLIGAELIYATEAYETGSLGSSAGISLDS